MQELMSRHKTYNMNPRGELLQDSHDLNLYLVLSCKETFSHHFLQILMKDWKIM